MGSMEGASAETTSPAALAEVRQLLDDGQSKPAVWKAKHIHKIVGSAESEALLVDAYLLRAEALAGADLIAEARSLLHLVHDKFAAARSRCARSIARLRGLTGDLADLVAPLADPTVDADDRRTIEQIVRQEVTDLAALARCSVLPADHPLRCAAEDAAEGFVAVTSGRVDDQQIALPRISRQSPLAPWKLLIRAIAFFHRGDHDDCRRCLEMIDAQSAPARLAPALRLLLGEPPADIGRRPAAAVLESLIQSDCPPLRQALADLEHAFAGDSLHALDKHIRNALKLCQKHRPDLLDKLRQHISIRGVCEAVPMHAVRKALGKPSLKNAYFWRLFALAAEKLGDRGLACSCWDRFRRHAIHERWFDADGAEVAALYVHMAGLLTKLPPAFLAELRREFSLHGNDCSGYYQDQPASIRALEPKKNEPTDLYFLSPERLLRRAAAICPRSEIFQLWFDSACPDEESYNALSDDAAQAWHEALPTEKVPLLYLAMSCERRKANKKALAYLAKAEALDAVSPQLRVAKLRILVAVTIGHLKASKPNLAVKDLAQIEALPRAAEGDRPALVAALRALVALLAGDATAAETARAAAADHLQSEAGALLLIDALARPCDMTAVAKGLVGSPAAVLKPPGVDLTIGTARACEVTADVGLTADIPKQWHKRLRKELNADASSAAAAQLLQLAETALTGQHERLAYAAAGAGLRLVSDPTTRAHLLLTRGQSMPFHAEDRAVDCLLAAATLARRQRDEDLAQRAVELARSTMGLMDLGQDDWAESLDEDELQNVIDDERTIKRFPATPPALDPDWLLPPYAFSTPGKPQVPEQPYLFDFLDEDDDLDEVYAPPTPRRKPPPGDTAANDLDRIDLEAIRLIPDDVAVALLESNLGCRLPPQLARIMLEMAVKHGGPDAPPLDPLELIRSDPELANRLSDALADLSPCDDLPMFGAGRNSRSRRPNRGKKH